MRFPALLEVCTARLLLRLLIRAALLLIRAALLLLLLSTQQPGSEACQLCVELCQVIMTGGQCAHT